MENPKKGSRKEKPLIVKGSFDDLIKISVAGNPKPKAKKKKEEKRK
jgi:hypothetical protein